jgi:hypothetical protein
MYDYMKSDVKAGFSLWVNTPLFQYTNLQEQIVNILFHTRIVAERKWTEMWRDEASLSVQCVAKGVRGLGKLGNHRPGAFRRTIIWVQNQLSNLKS